MDTAGRLRGDLHASDRRHDRQRRAAADPARSQRQPVEPAVGRRCLRPHPGLVPARARIDRRPPRPPSRLQHRLRHLHRGFLPLRPRRRPDRAQPRSRPAGSRRGGDVRHRPGLDRSGVRGPRTGPRRRDLGRDGRRRGGDRPARRRGDHRRARLGVDLLRQRPDRPRGDRHHRVEADQRQGHRHAGRSTGPASSHSPRRSSC